MGGRPMASKQMCCSDRFQLSGPNNARRFRKTAGIKNHRATGHGDWRRVIYDRFMKLDQVRIRVVDLETGGNGPDDVCEIGWQDLRRGKDHVWRLDGEPGALLVNPGRPMSPDTIAVHHILDLHIAKAPFWKQVASAVLCPEGGVAALGAHRAHFEQRYCRPSLTDGTGWICTWKCALRLWPHLPRFSNQMLRYLRTPEGLVHETGLPAHRAGRTPT